MFTNVGKNHIRSVNSFNTNNNYNKEKLPILQKKATRAISCAKLKAPSDPLFFNKSKLVKLTECNTFQNVQRNDSQLISIYLPSHDHNTRGKNI